MGAVFHDISKRFNEKPEVFADAFAKAWCELTHRDKGPDRPAWPSPWQDPVPAVDHALVDEVDVAALKAKLLDCGLSIGQLVNASWAAAAYRGLCCGMDKSHGA